MVKHKFLFIVNIWYTLNRTVFFSSVGRRIWPPMTLIWPTWLRRRWMTYHFMMSQSWTHIFIVLVKWFFSMFNAFKNLKKIILILWFIFGIQDSWLLIFSLLNQGYTCTMWSLWSEIFCALFHYRLLKCILDSCAGEPPCQNQGFMKYNGVCSCVCPEGLTGSDCTELDTSPGAALTVLNFF